MRRNTLCSILASHRWFKVSFLYHMYNWAKACVFDKYKQYKWYRYDNFQTYNISCITYIIYSTFCGLYLWRFTCKWLSYYWFVIYIHLSCMYVSMHAFCQCLVLIASYIIHIYLLKLTNLKKIRMWTNTLHNTFTLVLLSYHFLFVHLFQHLLYSYLILNLKSERFNF